MSTTEVIDKPGELIVLPSPEQALAVFSKPEGLDPYLSKIKAELDAFEPDITTKRGRDAIASIAYKVSKGKTALDNIGKELVAELKDVPKKVDAERKRMRDLLDQWKDEVRAPLTAWEQAEEARQHAHRHRIEAIVVAGRELDLRGSGELQSALAWLDEVSLDGFEEFTTEAAAAKDRSTKAVRVALEARLKYEAEQAELTALRAAAQAREQQDREDRIAREAADAARREADAAAQAERDAVAKREADAKATAERRELELKLQAERAEREKAEAIQREQQAQAQAAQRAADAVAAEQRRVAAAAEAEAQEAARRTADTEHRANVNRTALAAFIEGGLTEECAKVAITLIARGQIPAIAITY